MPRYLVTGGAGFIGSHLVTKLVQQGDPVRVADNLSSGQLANLSPVADRIEFLEGDIGDPDVANRAVEAVDVVFHLAALPSVQMSVDEPLRSHQHCATATLTVLDAARTAGVKRFILASSCGVYGDRPELPKREDQLPETLSPYTAAKLASEQYCQAFAACYDIETVALRFFNVYGPRQDPDSPYSAVIPLFLRAVLNHQTPRIYGDGRQSRDFVYVDDIVQANLKAATAPGVSGKTFNVGTGIATSLLDLIDAIGSLLDVTITPEFLPERPGDVRHSWGELSQTRSALGYQPQFDLQAGLRKTLNSFIT